MMLFRKRNSLATLAEIRVDDAPVPPRPGPDLQDRSLTSVTKVLDAARRDEIRLEEEIAERNRILARTRTVIEAFAAAELLLMSEGGAAAADRPMPANGNGLHVESDGAA